MSENSSNIDKLAHQFLAAWRQSIIYQREILPALGETLGVPVTEIFYRWNIPPKFESTGIIKGTQWHYFFHGISNCDLMHQPDGRFLQVTFGPHGRFDIFCAWSTLLFIMASKKPWPEFVQLKEFLAKKPPPYDYLSGSHARMMLLSDYIAILDYFEPAAPKLSELQEKYTIVDEEGRTVIKLPEEFIDFTLPIFWDILVCNTWVLSKKGRQALNQEEDTKGMTPEQLRAKYQDVQDQPNRPSLEGLDSIDWSALHHAHGEASDIPALLRAVLSDDENDRQFAFVLLHETIWHQGTVYEASAYAVPFLLRMLESPETPDKVSVVILLTSLATGRSYFEVHAYRDKESEATWRSILAKQGRELETETAREIEWVNATRKAVGKGLHLLYPYLDDASSSWYVANALAFYPERATETLPLLEKARATVNDRDVRDEIQVTIAKLTGANENPYP